MEVIEKRLKFFTTFVELAIPIYFRYGKFVIELQQVNLIDLLHRNVLDEFLRSAQNLRNSIFIPTNTIYFRNVFLLSFPNEQ